MAHRVTIQGSITPCVELARGEVRTVTVTDHIRMGVRNGYWNVIDGSLDEPEPEASTEPDEKQPPARNASRDDWAEFLAEHPRGFVTEGKDRGELIAEWDEAVSGAS